MSNLPLVLITGATGKTGTATVLALTEEHSAAVRTRALVRRDDHRAQALRDAGAEVVIGDMADIRDLRRAMQGVDRAHFLSPISNSSLDFAVNFAVAATEARVQHVTALSQWLSASSHPSVLTRRTWLVDQLLPWLPHADHTIINVGFFADNFLGGLGTAAQLGNFMMPLGAGATAPISNEDIGRVVAGVLANPAPYVGQTLRPTGPEVITAADMAQVLTEVLGRPVSYTEATEQMGAKAMRALGFPPFALAQVVHYMRDFRGGAFACGGTTDVVLQVTGRPAEDFATIARRYAAADPRVPRTWANLLRAIAQVASIMMTRPLDAERWQRDNDLPFVAGEDAMDATEWVRTHDVPQAYGVQSKPSLVALSTSG